MRRAASLLLLALFVPLAIRCDDPGRTLAITIDDLPYASAEGVAGSGSLADVRRVNEAVLAALARHKAPAVGFVNESRLQVAGERDERVAILRRWAEAGMVLGNHTFSHLRLQDTPLASYQDDIVLGDVATRPLMEGKPLFFRYPFNSTGPTKEAKEAVQADAMLTRIEARGYRFVTLEEALKDPAYSTPDEYVGAWGISWLHRWSVSLGKPMRLRDEPDPPQWVLE